MAKISTEGNYFDIFKTSDFMITDCSSFLGEYSPTMKPIIRPINNQAKKLNKLGLALTEGIYQTHNNEEFIKIFNKILAGEDDKADVRKNTGKILIDFNEQSCDKVITFLVNTLNLK